MLNLFVLWNWSIKLKRQESVGLLAELGGSELMCNDQ